MPVPLFRQLCEKTGQRDHALLATATQVRIGMAGTPGKPWPDYTPMLWRTAGRLARGILDMYGDFQQNLQRVSVDKRCCKRVPPMVCPVCGDPDCSEAMLITELSPAALQHVQQLLLAKTNPPDPSW